MSDTVAAIAFVASIHAILIISGLRWERHVVYRAAPVIWGALFGLAVAVRWDRHGWELLGSIAIGVALGSLVWFAMWVELRFGK